MRCDAWAWCNPWRVRQSPRVPEMPPPPASPMSETVLNSTSSDGLRASLTPAARLGQSWLLTVDVLLAAVLAVADLVAVGVPVRLAVVEVLGSVAALAPALLLRVAIFFHAAARALDRTSVRVRGSWLSRPVLAELAHATSHQVLSCP